MTYGRIEKTLQAPTLQQVRLEADFLPLVVGDQCVRELFAHFGARSIDDLAEPHWGEFIRLANMSCEERVEVLGSKRTAPPAIAAELDGNATITMRDRAIELAQQGFSVFPLKAGTKNGPVTPPGWPKFTKGRYFDEIPSSNPDVVYRLWTDPRDGRALDYNIGWCVNDLLAIDIDVKKDKPGEQSFQVLAEKFKLGPTVEARTPTGGRHLIYKLPEGYRARNTQPPEQPLGEGIDTRGWHGYVAAAGSRVPAGEYEWVRAPGDVAMATAPAELLELCKFEPAAERKHDVVPGLELDDPSAVKRAISWLKDHAPEAIEGFGGDNTTYRVACDVRDMGVEESTCLQLMLEHWNPEKAIPPWQPDELEVKVASAYQYAQNPAGSKSPLAAFGPVELEEPETSETGNGDTSDTGKRKLFWEGFNKSRSLMAKDGTAWLIKGYLGKGEMSVLYGDSNTGKTFVALDVAYHIATKKEWNGRKVKGGLVVYVAAEAGKGIRARIEALHRRYKPEKEPPLVVIPCLVDLFSPNADLKPLLAQLEEISKAYGMPIEFVVLDTLARVIGPGDENTARDMGVLVGSVDRIRVTTGAHTQLVHHSGKKKVNGARGSSALRAATDTELEVEGGAIHMRKQRNAVVGKKVPFSLQVVHLGEDEDGETVTSCTVDIGAAVDFVPQATHGEQDDWVFKLRLLCPKEFTRADAEDAWDVGKTKAQEMVDTLVAAESVVVVGEIKVGRPTTYALKK